MQAGSHAALMICAFFGTVISLERAVALGGLWPYLGPALAGGGGVSLLLGGPLLGAEPVRARVRRAAWRQPRRHPQADGAIHRDARGGRACWLAGNLVWSARHDARRCALCGSTFLVLTIAGERLELTRFLSARPAAAPSSSRSAALILTGAAGRPDRRRLPAYGSSPPACSPSPPGCSTSTSPATTPASRGSPASSRSACSAGYVWLGPVRSPALAADFSPGHPLHDTTMHAIALGFVFADGVRPRGDHLPGGAQGEDPLPPGLLRPRSRCCTPVVRAARRRQPRRAIRAAPAGAGSRTRSPSPCSSPPWSSA